jgi:hypothetical protein
MAAIPSRPQPTVEAIYRQREATQESGHRYHLGASLIGNECSRALWYTFRWATRAAHPGRVLGIFETGRREEARFVEDLRSIGVTAIDADPEDPAKQIGVRNEFGHFGGSLDAMLLGIPGAEKTWHVGEFKTHNSKSFIETKNKGVEAAKPQHYAQMQMYMHYTGVDRAFYFFKNKNDDDLAEERIKYDVTFALRMDAKADRIVKSPTPPQGVSTSEDWHACRMCDHKEVCHKGKMPERNCRTCLHSTPIEGGGWWCHGVGKQLSREDQESGCAAHLYIPDFIKGEQVDASDITVTYKMLDGSIFVDGLRGALECVA